ncbi:hypothetical protein Ciccas_003402 [Cichlidogyrus casuarinus]|uniref:Proteasome subunit beta n=1 Tax=Cichlidogyrus casuarinus TaxID=1844966 RepID=A0ABD2QEH5_9PLAT
MDCLFGIRFRDFALIAADSRIGMSVITYKHEEDKIYHLNDNIMMGVVGDCGDTVNFAEYIQQNLQLSEITNGFKVSLHAAAHSSRKFLADALRSRNPYNVNLIIAGYDKEQGSKIYCMDYLASLADVPYAMHGYGGFFSLSLLDREWNENMNVDQAIILVKKCIKEMQTRFVGNLSHFKLKIVDKDGIRELPPLILQPLE